MLNKFRIGNDIGVSWSLYDAMGTPIDLEDKSIEIELHVGSRIIPIDDFNVDENTVSFVYEGAVQEYTGTYSICLIDNSGNPSKLTIDEFKIFVLVDHTWESDNELSTDFEVEFKSVMCGIIGPNSGTPGAAAGFGTVDAEVDNTSGVPSVQVTSSGPDTAKNFHFAFSGLKGTPGANGASAGFGNISASVDGNVGTPRVEVSSSGPNTAKNLAFAFYGLKGEPGTGGGSGASDPTGFLSALTFDNTTRTWTLNGNFVANGEVAAGTAEEEE